MIWIWQKAQAERIESSITNCPTIGVSTWDDTWPRASAERGGLVRNKGSHRVKSQLLKRLGNSAGKQHFIEQLDGRLAGDRLCPWKSHAVA